VLSVSNAQNLRMPETGQFDFKLLASEAWEMQNGVLIAPASVTSGQFSVNFGARTFSTVLNVAAGGDNLLLRSSGRVTSTGGLEGALLYSSPGLNMNVRGSLAGNASNQAGYVFDAPISGTNRGVVGATSWGR